MTPSLLSEAQITTWLEANADWLRTGAVLSRSVQLADFPAAIALVVAVADAAQELDHHPDIDIRYDTVRFELSTHSAGGLTALDIDLAQRISVLAPPSP